LSSPPVSSTKSDRRSSGLGRTLGWAQRNGLFFALLILIAYFTTKNPRFLSPNNISTVFLQVAIAGLIAIPGAMLVLAGYVDLSVGSVMVLAAVVFGLLAQAGIPLVLCVLAALGAGFCWGLLNGTLISLLGLSPIVVTLGGLAAARGIAEALSQGQTVFGFSGAFQRLGNGKLLGLPVPVWIFVVVTTVGSYVWYQMPYGRYLTAIGADQQAAKALGVAVRRIPLVIYVASGTAAALGGLILTSQLDGASLSIGVGQELVVLTGILLGGVSFTGGRGSLFGVIVGVLFIGFLQNGLILTQVGTFYQNVAIGAALFAAAGLDVLYKRLDRIVVGANDD
jgi:ribose transport system permease protein